MSGYLLLVEDDPRLQKVFEIILQSAGYAVRSATGTAAAREVLRLAGVPDAVVLDLVLPGEDPFELVRELRELPRGQEMAVLAVSGSVSKLQEARATTLGFAEFLVKPVDKATLLDAIHRHLPLAVVPQVGENRRVLVVDDNPMQAKLARLRLTAAGFEVATASDGVEALAMARAVRPHAVVTDVIMPRMDGFQLCHAIRQDPDLRDIVLVMVSASYVDEAIRLLGQQVGADDFVMRTPDMTTVVAALRAHLNADRDSPRTVGLPTDYVPTLFTQLERQVMLNHGLTRRCTQLGTSLSLLASLSSSLTRTPDVQAGAVAMLEQLVADGRFAAAGLKLTAADSRWLQNPPEPLLAVTAEQERQCLETRETQMLRRGVGRLTLTPVIADDEIIALLALLENDASEADDSVSFARVLAAQLAQGLVMARILAEQAETQERFGQLARHIDQLFWLATADVREILFTSHAYERIWGTSPERLKGNPQAFLESVHPDDLAGFLADMVRLQSGQEVTQEFRVVHGDGTVRQLWQRCFPIRNSAGDVYRVCGVCTDVTEQRLLERQFRQSQKMEALGRLAGGVAHDFNNLLTVITGFGELALMELPPEHPQTEALTEILRASEKAALLTRQLLTFSRRDVVQPVAVDLNDALKDIHRMLLRVIGEDLQVHLVLCSESPTVMIDRGQLEQVVMNLAVNARDAMPAGGQLTLETSLEDLEEPTPDLAAGRYVRLAVSDTGCGMDDPTRQQIFEPFYTTKGAGGTGLGLATVFGIVRGAGGMVEAYSEVGLGSTFKVYLPYSPVVPPAARAVQPEAPRGSETILLVEDDEAVRRLARLSLLRAGYHVLEARCEREARAHCEADSGPIHLLLSDVVMPDVSGPALAQKLAALRPTMKVLFMSGYTDEAIFRYGILERGLAYMEKPFTTTRLAGKVREVLDA